MCFLRTEALTAGVGGGTNADVTVVSDASSSSCIQFQLNSTINFINHNFCYNFYCDAVVIFNKLRLVD